MNDLSNFNVFTAPRKKPEIISKSKEVWLYTRVSTKGQKDNYSLEIQNEESEKFAREKGYIISERFGNKNESASSDITRKEFQSLILKVRKSPKKPFAILVYVMSRFSRTGGSAIGIVNDLVEKMGVHLIEVQSETSTISDEGKLTIYSKLIEARRQNHDRLAHTLPGMKKFVKSGHSLGITPIGYDHFGPRVVDPNMRGIEQKIILNETGKKLKHAWDWKVQGMNDVEIRDKLLVQGVNMTTQHISSMWRKPFYCGIQTNALVEGKAIRGKWEPMITEDVFLKVQRILDVNHHGYDIIQGTDSRPLVGTIYCPDCGRKLTGYEVKKKRRHYYKCQKCIGVSIPAESSELSKLKGANNLFVELLESYHLDEKFIAPFQMQIKKIFLLMKARTFQERSENEHLIIELEKEVETLEERYAYGKIEEAVFQKYRSRKQEEIEKVRSKLEETKNEISNLEMFIKKSVEISQNISKYWGSGNLDVKRKIQKLVFPEGIILSTQNSQYLTSKVNSLFSLKLDFIRTSEDVKEKLLTENDEEFSLVAEGGFEPPTFGL